MPHKVQVNSTNTNVTLPNGFTYASGQQVVLTDEQFARLNGVVFTDGTLTDLGAVPGTSGAQAFTDEQTLNGTNQLANTSNSARFSFPRSAITIDSASMVAAGACTVTPVVLQAGDVISQVSYITGATAGATTHFWSTLFTPAGAQAAQTADYTTALTAGLFLTKSFTSAYTVPTTGVYYVGTVQAGTAASLLGHDYITTAGATGGLTQAVAARTGTAATYTTPTALTIGTVTGLAASRYAPYIVLN